MKQSQLANYVNPNPLYNCPHFAAWALAQRCGKWGFHNLRSWFWPPKVWGVALRPVIKGLSEPELFTHDMFGPEGFLHEVPLNHYVTLVPRGSDARFQFNAGYLLHHFVLSDKLGYAELRRLIAHAPTLLAPTQDSILPDPGASPEGRIAGGVGRESAPQE